MEKKRVLFKLANKGPSTISIYYNPQGSDRKNNFYFRKNVRYSTTPYIFNQINKNLFFEKIGDENTKLSSIDIETNKTINHYNLNKPADNINKTEISDIDKSLIHALSKISDDKKLQIIEKVIESETDDGNESETDDGKESENPLNIEEDIDDKMDDKKDKKDMFGRNKDK